MKTDLKNFLFDFNKHENEVMCCCKYEKWMYDTVFLHTVSKLIQNSQKGNLGQARDLKLMGTSSREATVSSFMLSFATEVNSYL